MNVICTLSQELQSLDVEQNHNVDNITGRTVDLEKSLASLQITVFSKHTNQDDKSLHNEAKYFTRNIRQKKVDSEYF